MIWLEFISESNFYVPTVNKVLINNNKGRGNFGDILAARKYWRKRSGFGGTKAEKETEVSSR